MVEEECEEGEDDEKDDGGKHRGCPPLSRAKEMVRSRVLVFTKNQVRLKESSYSTCRKYTVQDTDVSAVSRMRACCFVKVQCSCMHNAVEL